MYDGKNEPSELYEYECGDTVFTIYPAYQAKGQSVIELLQILMIDDIENNGMQGL